jgi:hypothetical protein
MFESKNWPNDPRIEYKAPFNLIKFIEMDGELEDNLEQFEKYKVFEV